MAGEVLPLFTETLDDDWVIHGPPARSVQWLHVENVYTIHFPENFETLKTSRLLVVCRHGTRGGTRGEEVPLGPDLYPYPSIFVFRGKYSG